MFNNDRRTDNTRTFNRNPRPQLDWEFVADFTHGDITARVTVLKFEIPEFSVITGTLMSDGNVKPYVRFKAKTFDELGLLGVRMEDYRKATAEATAYILGAQKVVIANHLEAQKAAHAQREKDEASRVEYLKQKTERDARKKKNHATNVEQRRVENRARAHGGGGGGKKKG